MLEIVAEAAKYAGGVGKLAAALGIARQNLNRWDKVPAERVIPMERATNGRVPRHRIRPDLFGSGAENMCPSAADNNANLAAEVEGN